MYNFTPWLGKRSESHDWFADAAECLVRFILAEAIGFKAQKFHQHWLFGSSKWGGDIVLIERVGNVTKKCIIIEVKSGGFQSWIKFKQKFSKFDLIARVKIQPYGGLKVSFYKTQLLGRLIQPGTSATAPEADLIG